MKTGAISSLRFAVLYYKSVTIRELNQREYGQSSVKQSYGYANQRSPRKELQAQPN